MGLLLIINGQDLDPLKIPLKLQLPESYLIRHALGDKFYVGIHRVSGADLIDLNTQIY